MESTKPVSFKQEDEISLKDLILKIQEWLKYLRRKWLTILIFGILGGSLGLTYSFIKKPDYTAELTFVLEDSKANTLGAYAGLASQFGIDLGGASGNGIFSGDNILEFLKSRLMIEKALLSPMIGQNKVESLADYYLDISGLAEAWEKDSSLKNIRYPLTENRNNFTLKQDSVLNVIYTTLLKKNLTVVKPDKKLSFISVQCISKDQHFSKLFIERLVKEAIDFYVQTKTQRSKITVDKLQEKLDSITFLLNRKTLSVAASQDMNLNPARSVAGVNIELASRDKMVLQTMYAEVMKNLELSKMAMAQETPIIQIVDTPILPLKKEKLGKLKGLIIGGFLGGFLIILWLLIRRIYSETMSQ
ncbi:Wzz/FepE/Etk N-terminal domain-containing protein [Chitinophaga sp. XS-30]|uniref:Wzz/FepE/Etk N-terminal domain-containing protein n=1 Tax=Chitinophaga sp. XS-30 TaxID=2604421 RepID=UPI0011DCC71C|nr:Wzz/FepE/Etk N-terminal domain-containing protein [Chitinophaga sp. XS-30]QEH39750.1 lipopolysaccharide biosynthesis protein [Chitinophaga sp. XS-30]